MKTQRSKILVAIDFEEQSLNAFNHSIELARLFDADLVLLYVIEGVSILNKLRSPDEYLKNLIAEAREKFDDLENLAVSPTLAAKNIKVTALIETGKPYEKIIEQAAGNEAILIVMGKNNNTSLARNRQIIGSNSLNVIREATCPVITIKNNSANPGRYQNILLPLDFTRQTKKQVQKAIKLGGYFGSQIYILSILREENKLKHLLKQVQLNQVKKAIQKNGIVCHSEFIIDSKKHLSEIVLNFSEKIDADLIIVMTQQKKSFMNLYVGSNAQRIISDSNIPVLSIIPTVRFTPGMITSMVDPLGLMDEKPQDWSDTAVKNA